MCIRDSKYFTLKKPKVLVSSCMYDDEAINSHVYNNIGVCNKVVNPVSYTHLDVYKRQA